MRKKRTAIYMTVNKVLVRLDQRANLIGDEMLRNARAKERAWFSSTSVIDLTDRPRGEKASSKFCERLVKCF